MPQWDFGVDTTSTNFPEFGFYKQEFPRFENPDTLTWSEVLVKMIFGPVHAYLIKQWEIYFSSNVRF